MKNPVLSALPQPLQPSETMAGPWAVPGGPPTGPFAARAAASAAKTCRNWPATINRSHVKDPFGLDITRRDATAQRPLPG